MTYTTPDINKYLSQQLNEYRWNREYWTYRISDDFSSIDNSDNHELIKILDEEGCYTHSDPWHGYIIIHSRCRFYNIAKSIVKYWFILDGGIALEEDCELPQFLEEIWIKM